MFAHARCVCLSVFARYFRNHQSVVLEISWNCNFGALWFGFYIFLPNLFAHLSARASGPRCSLTFPFLLTKVCIFLRSDRVSCPDLSDVVSGSGRPYEITVPRETRGSESSTLYTAGWSFESIHSLLPFFPSSATIAGASGKIRSRRVGKHPTGLSWTQGLPLLAHHPFASGVKGDRTR